MSTVSIKISSMNLIYPVSSLVSNRSWKKINHLLPKLKSCIKNPQIHSYCKTKIKKTIDLVVENSPMKMNQVLILVLPLQKTVSTAYTTKTHRFQISYKFWRYSGILNSKTCWKTLIFQSKEKKNCFGNCTVMEIRRYLVGLEII